MRLSVKRGKGTNSGEIITNANRLKILYKNNIMMRLFRCGYPDAARRVHLVPISKLNDEITITNGDLGVRLGELFKWSETREGHLYWSNIAFGVSLYESSNGIKPTKVSDLDKKHEI